MRTHSRDLLTQDPSGAATADVAGGRARSIGVTPSPARILFLVRGLHTGGAERQLVALARGLSRAGHPVSVAVFYAGGEFERDLRADGIPIHDLGKRGRWDLAPALARLVAVVRAERPAVVHAYMGLANLCSTVVKPLFPAVRFVWGIRSAIPRPITYGWASGLTRVLERVASPFADAIVANSSAARRQAIASGLDGRRMTVIPNGIDCTVFRPDPAGRARTREEWGIGPGATLVGSVARLDPTKDHPALIRAFAEVAAARPDARFVCIGGGDAAYRERLRALASELGLAPRLTWAGDRRAEAAIYSALDVSVLSSLPGESFPNVIGEAMACGVPCVVTDSGDAATIVGETGAVVPPGAPGALAAAILALIERLGRSGAALSSEARARIAREYSMERLVSRTAATLQQLVRAG